MSVRLSVGRLVGQLVMFVKKWPLEYQKAIKTYLPTYIIWDSSDSSESSDSCDSCDSSDSSPSSDSSDSSYQTTLWRLTFCD